MKRLTFIFVCVISILNVTAQETGCFGYEMFSNSQYYRASGSAVASTAKVAEQKALLIARQRIATQIETTVNSVTELYLRDIATNNDSQQQIVLQHIIQTTSNQLLVGSKIICQETKQTNDDSYESTIAIEFPTQNIIDSFNSQENTSINWKQFSKILESQINSKQ